MPDTAAGQQYAGQVLSSASSMLAYWDTDMICRYANAAYRQWFGIEAGQVVGMRLRDLLGADVYALNEPHARAALGGVPQLFERALVRSDGVRCHTLARYHPVKEGHAVVGFVAEVTDVTELKDTQLALQAETALASRAMAALHKQDAALTAAQRLGKIGSWEWEIETDITTWSPELYRLFRFDPARLPPAFVDQAELFLASSWVCLCEAVDAALHRGDPYVLRLEYWRGGDQLGWLEVRGEVERDSSGTIIGLRGTAQDVTTSQMLVDSVVKHGQRLKLALAAAQLGLWQWDVRHSALTCENERARFILGIREGGTRGGARDFVAAFVHPDDAAAFAGSMAESLASGSAFFFRGRIFRQCDGRLRWIELFARCDDFGGADKDLIGTIADITDSMVIRQALHDSLARLAAADGQKSEFLSMLGHELRNCLAPLATGLHALERHPQLASRVKIHNAMARQVAHMTRLVDDIYDLRRAGHGKLQLQRELVAVDAFVTDAIEMALPQFKQRGHCLAFDLAPEPLMVEGDLVRLTQALVNLLNNAAKFTPPGGAITLAVARETPSMVAISVSDNGIGLLPDELETVFGMYVQSHHQAATSDTGLGIGLHLVRELVTLHGGTVSAASEGRDRGSRFTICLPLAGQ